MMFLSTDPSCLCDLGGGFTVHRSKSSPGCCWHTEGLYRWGFSKDLVFSDKTSQMWFSLSKSLQYSVLRWTLEFGCTNYNSTTWFTIFTYLLRFFHVDVESGNPKTDSVRATTCCMVLLRLLASRPCFDAIRGMPEIGAVLFQVVLLFPPSTVIFILVHWNFSGCYFP